MRVIGTFFTLLLAYGSACARPDDLPWQPSPDSRHEISVRYVPLADKSGTTAKLFLRATKNRDLTETITLDLDAEDARNGVSVEWSPDSRCVAVTLQIGQLRSFTIYRLVSGRLRPLPELRPAKKLQPEHTKSRGGPAFQEWLDANTFKVFDSSSETEFTYRITKDAKLMATDAKSTNP